MSNTKGKGTPKSSRKYSTSKEQGDTQSSLTWLVPKGGEENHARIGTPRPLARNFPRPYASTAPRKKRNTLTVAKLLEPARAVQKAPKPNTKNPSHREGLKNFKAKLEGASKTMYAAKKSIKAMVY